MIRIEKILVPVDFSAASRCAVSYGVSLALQYDACLVLCHIVPLNVILATAFPTENVSIETDQLAQARKDLSSLVSKSLADRVDLQTIVKIGNVKEELLGIAVEEDVDLIVMGTHGRTGIEHFLLGSVTERILRKSPVPVLTVSNPDWGKEIQDGLPVPMHHIVYATDFSEHSEGLESAVELARGAHGGLTVLHVMEDENRGYRGTSWSIIMYASPFIEAWRREAMDQLENEVAKARSSGVEAAPMMVEGRASEEILRVAADKNADLIVINLQGKGWIDRALLGSTAERVIRMSPIPVLSIPGRQDDRHQLVLT